MNFDMFEIFDTIRMSLQYKHLFYLNDLFDYYLILIMYIYELKFIDLINFLIVKLF